MPCTELSKAENSFDFICNTVPVTWLYLGTRIDLEYVAGFGDPVVKKGILYGGTIRTSRFWGVRYAKSETASTPSIYESKMLKSYKDSDKESVKELEDSVKESEESGEQQSMEEERRTEELISRLRSLF